MAQSSSETQRAEMVPDLERADDLPVGAQLGWRLRVLIASGELAAGDRLPGVRELATGSGVNVNTARAVYRHLEDDGLIESRQGHGTFVADGAPASPDLERLAAEAASSARDSGVDPRDLARAIYAGSTPEPVPTTRDADERLARDELRRQIARLETELASYPGEVQAMLEPVHPLLLSHSHVPDAGELERTRDQLLDMLKRARDVAEDRGKRQRRARGRFEEMARDPAAHKWESVTYQEMGDPGCGGYEVQPRWGPVGALMNWWRVKVSSGCP